MAQKILLIYNPLSGFFVDRTPESVAAFFDSIFKGDAQLSVDILRFNPDESGHIVERITREKHEAVWVAGGDGTITSVARTISGLGIPLGVLPLGTVNFLARDLGMDLDIQGAVRQLKRSEPVPIDMATVNGHVFLNICNIGISTHFTRMREKFRHYSGWIRWPLLAWYMLKSVFVYPSMTTKVSINGRVHRIKTRSVSVSNNPFSTNRRMLPSREDINRGVMGIYVVTGSSLWILPVLVVKLLIGNWQLDRDLIKFFATSAVIHPKRKRPVKVMIDGELIKLAGPLNFSIQPGAVTVLRPCEAK